MADRPVDSYPIVSVDGSASGPRTRGVTVQTAHLVVDVDINSREHCQRSRSPRPRARNSGASVLTQLRNPGLRNILIACSERLTRLPDAINDVFPDTVIQNMRVHVIRSTMPFISYQDRKKIAAGVPTIYTTPSVEAAESP